MTSLLAMAVYIGGDDEAAELQEDTIAYDVQEKLELKDMEKNKNPVLTVRGAKLAADDKNPTDPFNPSHPTESEMKEMERKTEGEPSNSEVKGASAGKTQVVQQVNGSKAVEGASTAGKNDKLLKENTDVLELLGVMLSEDDKIALLNWRGRQLALGVGEMREGITLVSVSNGSAVILLEDKEKILNLK